jgi:hypothetical protein
MPAKKAAKKSSGRKLKVKVKDLKAKKDAKGGTKVGPPCNCGTSSCIAGITK